MKKFVVFFREPDGRTKPHTEDETKQHQLNWKIWLEKWNKEGKLRGGSGLTTEGRIIKGDNKIVSHEIHRAGTEIIGGFLMLNAHSFVEATEIVKSCPVFDFGGYAEIREMQI